MLTHRRTRIESDERRHGDAVFWAVVLIWAGLIFGADSLRVLPQIGQMDAWNWVLLGAGVVALVSCVYRATSPVHTQPKTSDYIWTGILIIVGLSGLTTVEIGFPLILLLVGVGMLVTNLLRSGDRDKPEE
jgi:hypothetical protein